MNFDVDRYTPVWAHVALCADLTWTTEPPDEFVIANQRLWAQHCRISQVLQDAAGTSQGLQNNQSDPTDIRTNQSQENGSCSGRRHVKDVIPESRLAQFYGNFYYDEVREKSYTSPNERTNVRGYNGQSCDNPDLTECWMLPEVEYWFRKLLDESPERSYPRRRRQYRMPSNDDFERWDSTGARNSAEEALAARVRSVRPLWNASPGTSAAQRPKAPSPPPAPRKMRARRRQPRRLTALAPPPPAYYVDVPQLFCDPTCKFQYDQPRPLYLTECQRALGRLSASVQAALRASAARCPPYRGTNVSRYAPTGQRPARYSVPRDHVSPRLNRFQVTRLPQSKECKSKPESEETEKELTETTKHIDTVEQSEKPVEKSECSKPVEKLESSEELIDAQPSTSAAVKDSRKKRLYSTVLSMNPPAPINLSPVGCVRLSQKLAPGLLKLNPKLVIPSARIRPNAENKFEELEKEALEQYKASDESIDTKFRELEKQAVEQYNTSNSNTSCSSGNSAEKGCSAIVSDDKIKKQPAKFHKDKAVDSVVIYSQNFPDLSAKSRTSSVVNLKNFRTPPRGDKQASKEQHRQVKVRNLKTESQRAASDTDYEARKGHKGPMRWTLHVMPPKKRHLTQCASDFSSDEDIEDAGGSIKDAGPRMKNPAHGKAKMSAHGAGDLHPIVRKT